MKITIPSKKNPGTVLRRVDEVFDCWFESGSMPYAQQHYPFENKERFREGFPRRFHRRGAGSDPRVVLHADGIEHGAVRQAGL